LRKEKMREEAKKAKEMVGNGMRGGKRVKERESRGKRKGCSARLS